MEQDQLIEGSVTLSQSKENPRFMNIHLEYTSVIYLIMLRQLKSYYGLSEIAPSVDILLCLTRCIILIFICCSNSSGGRSFVKESVMR